MQFAWLYPHLYKILQPTFSNCLWCGEAKLPQIALTFDDGPHPEYTPKLLKVLARHQIQASFFLLGVCASRFPQIVQEIYQQGHWIGLHGWQHKSFPLLNSTQLHRSLEETKNTISQACQLKPEKICDVRPPNGFFTLQTLKLLQNWQYRPVMWSVVPEDWVNPGVAVVSKRVLKQVKNGSLIVLHDGYFGGKDVAQVADLLIPKLLEQGYQFVSVDTLWQQHRQSKVNI